MSRKDVPGPLSAQDGHRCLLLIRYATSETNPSLPLSFVAKTDLNDSNLGRGHRLSISSPVVIVR